MGDCSSPGLKREVFCFTTHGNLWTKGQIYESPHGKMLSSTKTTVIPWRVFRIPELRSQKSLWSLTRQYSG